MVQDRRCRCLCPAGKPASSSMVSSCRCSCVVLPMLLSLVVRLQASLGAVMILSAADAVAGVKLTPAAALSAEHDHLAGVLFPDRVLPESFDSIKPELIKMEEEFAAANPDMNVQSISKFRYPAHN